MYYKFQRAHKTFLVFEASRKMLDGKVCHVRGLLDYKASLGSRCIQLGWTKLVYMTDKLRGERRIRAGLSAVTFRDTVLSTNFNILKQICFCLVTKSYLTLWNPKGYNTPGSSVHEISQVRILDLVAIENPSQASLWNNNILKFWIECIYQGSKGALLRQEEGV